MQTFFSCFDCCGRNPGGTGKTKEAEEEEEAKKRAQRRAAPLLPVYTLVSVGDMSATNAANGANGSKVEVSEESTLLRRSQTDNDVLTDHVRQGNGYTLGVTSCGRIVLTVAGAKCRYELFMSTRID